MSDETIALATIQFYRESRVHLVRQTSEGWPGPTLCGLERFRVSRSWTLGTYDRSPGTAHEPCTGCADVARGQFAGLPVADDSGARAMAAATGTEVLDER
jgi:hypothetical protein